jgi:CRISPR/Cas system-associated protein Cas10 (large subunit of type III CRISPR-Cas system)
MWQDSPYTLDEATVFFDARFENRTCSFCGRKPHEIGFMLQGRDAAMICNLCVASFHKALADSDE